MPAPRETAGKPLWRAVPIYSVAVTLSWLAAEFSFKTPAFASVRLGPSYVIIVAVAILWGWGPALAALGASALAFRSYAPVVPRGGHWGVNAILPISLMVLVGTELVLMMWRSQSAERSLRIALARLSESSQALLQAQQASQSAAWTFDVGAGTMRWYEGGAKIFGRPNVPDQSLESLMDSIMEEDRGQLARSIESTRRTGRPFLAEYRAVWPNGEVHWLESRGTATEADPNIWRGVTIDITERKRAEVALIQTEKLAVAGRLAAAIAHEINNPLEAITNLCYLARSTADEETGRYIAMAEEELSRVAHITTQTLRFHRQQSAAGPTDLRELVDSIVGLYEARLRRLRIEVTIEAHPMPKLLCFAGEIRQVLANLIGNALDAMEVGGVLRVRLRPGTAWHTGEAAARVTICDTGHGIPPETLSHIYEPFFTTKTDVGTGLGLWVSSTLIEKHHGRLWVRSSTNPEQHGTVFSVVLPYNAAEVAEAMLMDAVPAPQ